MASSKSFRKHPAVVEAFKWAGDYNALSAWAWSISHGNESHIVFERVNGVSKIYIQDSKGNTEVQMGHYVMCDIKGIFYTVTPEEFAKTYEVVSNG